MRLHWKEKLGLRYPILQAGMAGGLATADLAAAVSRAGALGTLGLLPPELFESELARLRSLCEGKPFAANLLLPFTRRAHVQACLKHRPAVVTLFFGFDRGVVQALQQAGILVLHQIGSEVQAIRALRAGADGLIVQGEEAGGHLAGTLPLAELLPPLRARYRERLILAAGGIHDAATVRAALAMGADGVVAGTRFLMTHESRAHPEYLARLTEARSTLRTRLFGMAWPADHRVVPNAATARWCTLRPEGPHWVTAVNTATVPMRRLIPMQAVSQLVGRQRLQLPFYSPAALTSEMDARVIDTTPLYAGACVAHIDALLPAEEVVARMATGLH